MLCVGEIVNTHGVKGEIKVNGNKLKVVGYYKSNDGINSYFVSSNTKKYELIDKSRGIVVYTKDKDSLINKYKNNNIEFKDVYETDKNNYIKEQKDNIISSVVVSLVAPSNPVSCLVAFTPLSFSAIIELAHIPCSIATCSLRVSGLR